MNHHTLGCASLLLAASVAPAQNLLRNPGFEAIPGATSGQGLMPSEWFAVSVTPDTYSNDGSYGLTPDAYGNYPGVVAASGLRWVAASSTPGGTEAFGQSLDHPLTPGATYRVSGLVHEAMRPDLTHAGAFRVLLATTETLASGVEVGRWDDTTGQHNGWEQRSFTFVAPADADVRPVIMLVPDPSADGPRYTYPALDDVALELVPAPACAGDVDGDGDTDAFDFAELAANFDAGPDATREMGDLNGDGHVDVLDFAELAADFGCGAP